MAHVALNDGGSRDLLIVWHSDHKRLDAESWHHRCHQRGRLDGLTFVHWIILEIRKILRLFRLRLYVFLEVHNFKLK